MDARWVCKTMGKDPFMIKDNVKLFKMRSKSVHISFIYAQYTPLGDILKKIMIFTTKNPKMAFSVIY